MQWACSVIHVACAVMNCACERWVELMQRCSSTPSFGTPSIIRSVLCTECCNCKVVRKSSSLGEGGSRTKCQAACAGRWETRCHGYVLSTGQQNFWIYSDSFGTLFPCTFAVRSSVSPSPTCYLPSSPPLRQRELHRTRTPSYREACLTFEP